MMRRGMIVMAAALSLAPVSSFADDRSTWSALTTVGLNGTWAISCANAASVTNWRVTYYRDADGHVLRSADRGPGMSSRNMTIDNARAVSPTQVQMRTRHSDPNWGSENGVSYDLLIEVTNNQARTLQSTKGGATQIFTRSNPGPSLEKCSN